jgi:hypothetical protein
LIVATMFRFSKENPEQRFHARVFDELRSAALLQDHGTHLVALTLLRPTIDRINSALCSSNNTTASTTGGVVPMTEDEKIALAVSRGQRIVDSAAEKRREGEATSTAQHHQQRIGGRRRQRNETSGSDGQLLAASHSNSGVGVDFGLDLNQNDDDQAAGADAEAQAEAAEQRANQFRALVAFARAAQQQRNADKEATFVLGDSRNVDVLLDVL